MDEMRRYELRETGYELRNGVRESNILWAAIIGSIIMALVLVCCFISASGKDESLENATVQSEEATTAPHVDNLY